MPFSINNEHTWRVTTENPIREMEGLDWERCTALHNLIVRLGLSVHGKPEPEMPRTTWWQRHITSPTLEEEWTRRLSASLKQFLQTAIETPSEQNFFYYVNGLTWPGQLFIQGREDEGIMCLYQMTNLNIGGHRDGLNFDQETSLAIFHTDILDSFVTGNGRTIWDPLEVVLTSWLDMIDTGKIVCKSPPVRGPSEARPWELLPYSESDLQSAVNGFDNLILGIECLLENPHLRPKDESEDQAKLLSLVASMFDEPRTPEQIGLISKEVLDSAGIGEGFIRTFLSSVRRPRKNIKFIAPGLRLLTEADFTPPLIQNSQIPGDMNFENGALPIALFPSDIQSTTPIFEDYPFSQIENLPFGLWMGHVNRDDEHVFEDGCRLYLPFEIGANGFARLADNSLLGEDRESKGVARSSGRRDDLFQLGYNHYIPGHGPQLGCILELWSSLVGMGEWEVDEEGVQSDLEKFGEADTEEHAHKYQLSVKW